MTLKAIIHKDESSGYWAEVPSLPGCFTQGETTEEVRKNLNEAVEAWLLANQDLKEVSEKDEVVEIDV